MGFRFATKSIIMFIKVIIYKNEAKKMSFSNDFKTVEQIIAYCRKKLSTDIDDLAIEYAKSRGYLSGCFEPTLNGRNLASIINDETIMQNKV